VTSVDRPRLRALRFLACGAVLAGFALAAAAPAALADGIPTPVPGAASGPSGDDLRSIATADGLTCRDDAGAAAPEASCTNATTPGGEQYTATFFTNPALVLVASSSGTPPLTDKARSFLVDMAAPFCAGGAAAVGAFYDASLPKGFTPTGYQFEDAACRLTLTFNDNGDFGFRTLIAFSLLGGAPVPSIPASLLPAPTGTAAPAATTIPAPVPGGGPHPTAGAFAGSIAGPGQVSTDVSILAESAALALLIVLLMPFPAQLFNSTLEAHYDEVRGWFPRIRLPFARGEFWKSAPGVGLFLAASALLYALLDPGLALEAESAAEVVGIGLGILVTAFAFEIPSLIAHRRLGDRWRLQVLPGTIVVGIVCVVISRVTGFLPGYVYGLILGLSFARELPERDEGRGTALAGVLMLGVAVLAWFALSALGSEGGGVLAIAARTILAAVVVGGLEGVVFGLAPLRFLQGEVLWAWNRIAWGVVFGLGVFAFAHILINPQSGYLSDSSRTPLLTILGLFIGFGIVSVAFWAYFRYRPTRPESGSSSG
jgi:hypothetical protein